MQVIRQKVEELVAACQAEGLNPHIDLWFHTSNNDIPVEQAANMIKELGGNLSVNDYNVPVDYTCIRSELPFASTYIFVHGPEHKEEAKALIGQ